MKNAQSHKRRKTSRKPKAELTAQLNNGEAKANEAKTEPQPATQKS
ncbi:hypothetical protein [Methylovulum sp.]|nr:hypothetical protein [Methylovulum sp.]MDD5125824.1 hypothetical protein [Methylovulum sp.]